MFGALRAQDHEPNIADSDNRIDIRKEIFNKEQAFYSFPKYNFNPKLNFRRCISLIHRTLATFSKRLPSGRVEVEVKGI